MMTAAIKCSGEASLTSHINPGRILEFEMTVAPSPALGALLRSRQEPDGISRYSLWPHGALARGRLARGWNQWTDCA